MIRELDSPPYTVDTLVLRRFDQRQTVFGRRTRDSAASFYGQSVHARVAEVVSRNLPGYSRMDFARARAAWTVSDHFRGAYSWNRLSSDAVIMDQLGRIDVTNTEAVSAEVKQAAITYGAAVVGICDLDHRWVYARDMAGDAVEIPPEFGHAVVMAISMDAEVIRTSPAFSSATAVGMGYSRMAFAIACLAEFIRNLGFEAIPAGNDTALSIPLAIDAGLGELGRNGLLITPQYGPCVRLCKVFTDLPLKPDKPIEFGAAAHCRRCKRCASSCEAGAIQSDPEPSFETACPSNNRGILRWPVDHDRCYAFWMENGASCSTCVAACPFTPRMDRSAGQSLCP